MIFNSLHKRIAKVCSGIVLCALLVSPLTYTDHSIKVQTAHAQWAVIVVEDIPFFEKEFLADLLQWIVIDGILNQMIDSVLDWVASGFEGSPAFVTDLRGYMLNIADEQAGQFLYENSGLDVLCSPFKLDVPAVLSIQYYGRDRNFKNRVDCRISDMVDNVDDFVNNGNFFAGGWDGFFELTQSPQNNFHGALGIAQEEMSLRIVNAQGREVKLLEFGRGFLPFKICKSSEAGNPNCSVVTPGAVIEEQVNKTLGVEMDRLVTADEIDEAFAAMAVSLVNRIVQTAGNGLLGVQSSEFNNQALRLLPHLEEHWIEPETRWLNTLQRGLGAIESAVAYAEATCRPGTPPPLPSSLAASRNQLTAQTAASEANLAVLNGFAARIQASPSPEEQLAIMNEFNQIPRRTDKEIEELGEEVDDVVEAADGYRQLVDSQCDRTGGQ